MEKEFVVDECSNSLISQNFPSDVKMSKTEDETMYSKDSDKSLESKNKKTDDDGEPKYDPIYYCRTCASKDAFFVPIFKGEGLNHQLNKKIEKYLPIHVSKDDDLPLQLCYNCASTIIAWDALIVGCIEAEKKLKSLKSGPHQYTCEDSVNVEKTEETFAPGSINIDSDDEPLITKKLAVKNFRKRRNKKQTSAERNESQQCNQLNENDIERPETIRQTLESSLIHENEMLDNKNIRDEEDNTNRCDHFINFGSIDDEHHCPVCLKTFSKTTLYCEDLYSHLKMEPCVDEDVKYNSCRICNKALEKICELPPHLLYHLDSRRVKGMEYRRKKRKKACVLDDPPFKSTCEICGKTVSRKYTMKRHLITHSGEKRYTCHHCGKQYAQESGLQRHVSVIHEGIRKYKCPICSKIFGTNFELKTHQYTHTDPRPFQCDQCGKMFVCQKHLYHHRKYHHTANGLRQLCKICNRYFSSPGVLKRHHKVIHLGLKEFQCHICSAQLSTKQYLQEHLKIHTDERPEVCSFCGKTFQMSGNLRQHMKIHMEKTQICDVCGKGFTRRCHLLTHMGSHKGLEQPRCQFCQKNFILKTDLEKHLKSEHSLKTSAGSVFLNDNKEVASSDDQGKKDGTESSKERDSLADETSEEEEEEEEEEEKENDFGASLSDDWDVIPKAWLEVISCRYCGKISCASKHLKQHEQRKTCLRNFECNICQQGFTKKINLERHIKKHEREKLSESDKRFTCGVCNKKFKFEDNGLTHEKLCGKDDSTFKCSVCGKRFETKTLADQHSTSHHKSCVCHMCGQSFNKPESLKQHIKTIHEEFKMVCHYCGREFTRKARLQEHLQHHTGKMDFTCHICGKGSTNAYSFSVHLATHTQETPFSCSFCPRTFKHMKYVYLHERAVHLKLKSGKTYIKPKKPGKNVAQRTCPLCNKTFKRESAMLIHKRSVHEGKNGYICKLCGKDFKYTYLLYVHKKKHHFPELCKYICQFCEKPFPVKTELEKHLRKHTGEKPYICTLCGKNYSFHGSLNMHIKTQHENKKNFKCESCDASFNFRSHLVRHMSAHADKFPVDFSCT